MKCEDRSKGGEMVRRNQSERNENIRLKEFLMMNWHRG